MAWLVAVDVGSSRLGYWGDRDDPTIKKDYQKSFIFIVAIGTRYSNVDEGLEGMDPALGKY